MILQSQHAASLVTIGGGERKVSVKMSQTENQMKFFNGYPTYELIRSELSSDKITSEIMRLDCGYKVVEDDATQRQNKFEQRKVLIMKVVDDVAEKVKNLCILEDEIGDDYDEIFFEEKLVACSTDFGVSFVIKFCI